ncbi:response regulator [Tenacibaculum agarivorans]|uniref:response regulator n=1 Tax=Tenacibaculum agarivorans TaxID=1908389 RepID=UPI00094B7E82|nr:response regulator [Tenacibaculum agarivorans]
MKKKLKSILLIDNSEADIFLMSRVIKKSDFFDKILVSYNAQEALDMLFTNNEKECIHPDLILLDINMPGMTGWDFLDEYIKLSEKIKTNTIICMISTSEAIEDKEKANQYDILNAFINKPLTLEEFISIINTNFADYCEN